MADGECVEERPFEVDGLGNMCNRNPKQSQSLKANYKTWCVHQQQRLQAEREELEDELRQLRNRFAGMELADVRATAELKQLLSHTWTNRDGSPDIEELFAEAHRRNAGLRRIKEYRGGPGEDKKTMLHEMEKIQTKLKDLSATYDLIQEEVSERLRDKLEQLWQRQNQPNYLASSQKLGKNAAQRKNGLMIGRTTLDAEEVSVVFSASAHEQKYKRFRGASIETTGSNKLKKSASSRHPDLCLSGEQPRGNASNSGPTSTSTPNSSHLAAVPVTRPKRKLSKLSPVIFRNQQGRYKIERARPGRNWITPKEHQDQHSTPSSIHFLPSTHVENKHNGNDYAGSNNLERMKDLLSSTGQA